MKTELEAVLRVIYARAGRKPETARVHIDGIDRQTLARLIASHYVTRNVDDTVTLTITGLVVARRPRPADDPAPDGQL